MRTRLLSAFFALLVFAALPVWSQMETSVSSTMKVVTVQGVGAAEPDAIANGEGVALRQCLQLYCNTKVLSANNELLQTHIYQNASQFVQNPQIISEGSDSTGHMTVHISVQVDMARIQQSMDDLWQHLKLAGNPRIIISIDQRSNEDAGAVAQNAITDKLVNMGFKVLDADQLKKADEITALKLVRDGSPDAVSIKALQDRADVVIVGRATARLQQINADPLTYSCSSSLDAKAISTDTAQVIAAARGKAVKADFTQADATETALEMSGQDWVNKNLATLVRTIVDPCKEYSVSFTGCSNQDVDALDARLSALPSVRQTDLVAFDKGLAQLTVQYQGSIMNFQRDLATVQGIEVQGTSHSTVRINRIKGEIK